MKIITAGRTDLEEYFRHITSYSKLQHTPFLAFCESEAKKTTGDRLKYLNEMKSHYKYQASGQSSWAQAHKDTVEGIKSIHEAKENLRRIEKEIKKIGSVKAGKIIEVKIIDNKEALLELEDKTPVMGQWSGQWRSDFFQFTVGDLRKFINYEKI